MPSTPQPLLRDVIEIPEAMTDSDFVLELASGVSDAESTLREYVIPDGLVDNFDEALGLVKAAITGQKSKAAYLHGSFGSGKSHFMAVLHALLRGERAARERPEFAGLLAKHDWLEGRRFLLVPYQMLGAKTLEQRVFGRYIDYVRALHSDAPYPAVHRTDPLLEQNRLLRERIGDNQFIAGLSKDPEDQDEWGDSKLWTPERLDAAFAAPYDDALRRALVNDLLQSWSTGFLTNAKEDAEAFVSLDAGLKEISRHAKGLGYDGLVLFLDELVLWLINSAGDAHFVHREVQKITNLVESGDPDRPAPAVSFIARQRDLREALGEEVTGATELSILDTLDLAHDRIDTITLEDRNLPVIARERILRRAEPVAESEAAISRAFESTTKLRQQVFDTLLGSTGATGADIEAFRKTYPFSPAFLDTLVHLSAALQRSRTALKLMSRLLSRRRDDLRLGELVPLGDLYDVITEGGDEPFTEKLKTEFAAVQKLYAAQLRPYLLETFGITEDDIAHVRRGTADQAVAAKVTAFTGDDRLMKTLLLSALAPTVPALHNLTASRLSALNHGSVTSPVPGTEVQQVAGKVETWAGRFTEVTYAKGDDPGVGLELIGVDVESVLAPARARANTEGARKNQIKKLLYAELNVTETGQYEGDRFDLVWRGSKRSVEVLFENIRDDRDLPTDRLQPGQPTRWRMIVDFPFDVDGQGPADDRNRLVRLAADGFQHRTLCWIPAFLTTERLRDLGELVAIDFVLGGQRFEEYAGHLNPTDRHRARQTLEGQRGVLRDKLTETLRQAYGLITKQSSDVVTGYDDHLISLDAGLHPKLPSGGGLAGAMRSLAEQMLAAQYPAHPDFDPDRVGALVRPTDVRTVLEYVRRAAERSDGRVEVDRQHRATMKRIANPVLLGEMHEAAFVLGTHWKQHFHQQAAKESITGDLRVVDLNTWLDQPEPRGLEPLTASLVVAAFAEQTDRAVVHRGQVLDSVPEPGKVTADMALREQRRPGDQDWAGARQRAMEVFGHNPPANPRAAGVRMCARQLSDDARRFRDAAHRLVAELEAHAGELRIDPDATHGRLHTARCAADLLEGLGSRHDHLDIITHLAGADLGGPPQRTGKSIKSAADVANALQNAPWDNLRIIAGLASPYSTETERVLAELAEAAAADELTTPLRPALATAGAAAAELLRKATARTPTPPAGTTPSDPTGEAAAGAQGVPTRATAGATSTVSGTGLVAMAKEIAAEHPDATIEVTWRVVEP